MTIAAPPMATTKPRFTSVLLLFVVTRQDRRIISASMVRRQRDDMRLGENLPVHQLFVAAIQRTG
jgi:hypothetical protein